MAKLDILPHISIPAATTRTPTVIYSTTPSSTAAGRRAKPRNLVERTNQAAHSLLLRLRITIVVPAPVVVVKNTITASPVPATDPTVTVTVAASAIVTECVDALLNMNTVIADLPSPCRTVVHFALRDFAAEVKEFLGTCVTTQPPC